MSRKSECMTGIEVLHDRVDAILQKRNVALVTSSTTVDAQGIPVYQTVKKLIGGRMKSIWSLQHGFFIDKQDNMIFSDSFYWEAMECDVRSLYRQKLVPEEDWLEGVDALLVDVFDVGTRVYTFLNHVVWIMKFLSGRNVDVIILDRPNPINGQDLEGNIAGEPYFSLVGSVPVPMRHGLTGGELLSYALTVHDIQLKLEVVKIPEWKRRELFTGTWTYPSPNMPGLGTAVVYPGSVMFEGTNISEGRGTTRPFEFIGSPFLDNFRLVDELGRQKMSGVRFIPLFFKPEFSKYAGQVCQGLMVIPDRQRDFNAFGVYYEILRIIMKNHPDRFNWIQPPYEFEYRRLPIDMICGSDLIRKSLEKNVCYADIHPMLVSGISEYRNKVGNFLLYP